MQPIKTYCAQNSVRLLMAAAIIAGLCFGVLDPSVAVAGGFVFLGDTAPTSLKELHEAMQKAFDTMRGEIKKVQDTADGALTEVKKEGTLHGETNTKLTEVMTAAKAAQDQVKEFATRILDVEQKLVRRPGGGNGDEAKSIGTRFVESKEFKDAIAAGNNSTPWVKIGSIHKALISDASGTNPQALVAPQRAPGIIMPALRRLTIRDLLPQLQTDSNLIYYAKENVFTNNAAIVFSSPNDRENVSKPESTLTFTAAQAVVETIAHWLQASRQILPMPKACATTSTRGCSTG
jgi:HK97 family phage major capsid protein